MTPEDRRGGASLLFATAFLLIVTAAVALGAGSLSDGGVRLPAAAFVASVGGLLLLWLGVIRSSESPPSAG